MDLILETKLRFFLIYPAKCVRGLSFPLSSVLFFDGYVIHALVRYDIRDMITRQF